MHSISRNTGGRTNYEIIAKDRKPKRLLTIHVKKSLEEVYLQCSEMKGASSLLFHLIGPGKGCFKRMYKCLAAEIGGGFYPKLIQRLRNQFRIMAKETQEGLQFAINQGLTPLNAVHQKVFSRDHILFAVPIQTKRSAEKIIGESIELIKCLKSMIQGTDFESNDLTKELK